jgi:uncharacterized protein
VEQYRSQLLDIKFNRISWDEVNQWRLGLHQDFDLAFSQTRLPERPDYEQANAFLIRARRAMVNPE